LIQKTLTLHGKPIRRLAVVIASLVLLVVAVRLAWLGDDAYITLRSVENWVRGNGLRWNPDDRVQTYTHPLWMLVMSLGRWLSGELYFTTIAISISMSMLAIVWMLSRAATASAIVATASILVCARTFTDYMSSGLETPLTFVLLVLFVSNILSDREAVARYSRAVLLATLLATNRMDLALLCLPPVLATMRGVPFSALWRQGLLMSSPFFAWLLFAGLYYGSPFPVTAHAKAFGVGIPGSELFQQGLRYVEHTLWHDPVLCVTTIAGAVLLLLSRPSRWLALGALCYLGYVLKVGGGFMQGRFFLPPFVVVVTCLGPWLAALPRPKAMGLVFATIALMLVGGWPSWLSRPASDLPLSVETVDAQHGIGDERLMYYKELGMLAPSRNIPVFGALEKEIFPEGREARWWLLNGAVGVAGFSAGADGHVVDPLLCDALIARLPARDPKQWKIGHVLRRIPEGYWESLASGENRIHHEGLRNYYEALRTLTQAPVFDSNRLSTLWQMALGRYDQDFQSFLDQDYYNPPRVKIPAAELPGELELGSWWFDEPEMHLIYEGGVAIQFAEAVTARELTVQTTGIRLFRFRFVQAGQVFGETMGVPLPPKAGLTPLQLVAGLRSERVVVPEVVPQFDALWIDCVEVVGSNLATGPAGFGAITPQK
jgi:arabinofuranosyltransferase